MRQTDFIITEYELVSDKITQPLCMAMIADLHNREYGMKNEKLLQALKEKHVDLILLAGDMLVCHDGAQQKNRRTLETVVRMAEIAPVFYSIGNHEKGIMDGVRNMDGEWPVYRKALLACPNLHLFVDGKCEMDTYNLTVYGLDLDRSYYTRFVKKKLHEDVIVEKLGRPEKSRYNVLLAHNPDYFRAYANWEPDLIVSGHNHGGMIRLPRIGGVLSPRLHPFPIYDYGMYKSREFTSRMIVTSGCGMHSFES